VLEPAGPLYIAPDHLGAPHQITDASGNTVWLWDQDPFGNGVPGGTFSYDLRFPGQFYDPNAKLHYNYYRDYDPNTGRYIESDPIGLRGGINTYAYVAADPVNLVDRLGLDDPSKVLQDIADLEKAAGDFNPAVSIAHTIENTADKLGQLAKDLGLVGQCKVPPEKMGAPLPEGGTPFASGSGGPDTGPDVRPSDQIVPNSTPGSTPVNIPGNVAPGPNNDIGNTNSSPNAGMGLQF